MVHVTTCDLHNATIVRLERELSEARAERDTHKKSLDMLYGEKFSDRNYHALKSRAERAEAERERLREDAERYRWLREDRVIPADFYPSIPWTVRVVLDPLPTTRPVRGGALDAAIDAARKP